MMMQMKTRMKIKPIEVRVNMIAPHLFLPRWPSKVPFANLQCASCAAWDQIRKRHVDEWPERSLLKVPALLATFARKFEANQLLTTSTYILFVFATLWISNMCVFCCTFFKGNCHPTFLFGNCCLAVCSHSLWCAACACTISQCPTHFCMEDHSIW